MKLEGGKFRSEEVFFIWGGSRLRISLPPETAKASCVVGFERAEIWMGGRNAETYRSQERVHSVNWVEILSFQAKYDLCLSQARICSGTSYFSGWWDSRSRPEHPQHKAVMQRSSFREPAAAPDYDLRICHRATLPLTGSGFQSFSCEQSLDTDTLDLFLVRNCECQETWVLFICFNAVVKINVFRDIHKR